MKRTVFTLGAALALGISALSATPAAAAITFCNGGAMDKIYLYQHDGYNGGCYDFSNNDGDFSNNYWNRNTSHGTIDNGASSMINRTSRNVTLYTKHTYYGDTYTARANSMDNDLTNNGFDNVASSLYFY